MTTPAKLTCPKCAKPMEKVGFEGIEVDRCTFCKGIWFDLQEHVALKNRKGSEAIDVGAAGGIGKEFHADLDAKRDIDCPVCKTRLVKLSDPRQPHIWFEKCQNCSGVFLDAGEFTDLKHHTLGDVFKDLFRKKG